MYEQGLIIEVLVLGLVNINKTQILTAVIVLMR